VKRKIKHARILPIDPLSARRPAVTKVVKEDAEVNGTAPVT
jgi:hypothetical protein